MIDITRNIVVTAENVDSILYGLEQNMRIGQRSISMLMQFTKERELHNEKPQNYSITIQLLRDSINKAQDLIDRIELIKPDLSIDGFFCTSINDKDCQWVCWYVDAGRGYNESHIHTVITQEKYYQLEEEK